MYKIHLINDQDDEVEDESIISESKLTPNTLSSKAKIRDELDNGLPKVQKMPKFMKIPNLWDIKMEKCDDTQQSTDDEDGGTGTGPCTGSDCSEWEFL